MNSERATHRGPGIKQWRLIIRNLSFDTKDSDVRGWVAKFGKILEIVLPKCKDPRYPESCAGFCFVQFSRQKDAESAKNNLNFTELKGRKVAVDWALDKDSYVTQTQEGKESGGKSGTAEGEGNDLHLKKEEIETDDDEGEEEEKIRKKNKRDKELEVKSEPESEEEGDQQVKSQEKKANGREKRPKKERTEDGAVGEGRVVFLRNIPFSVDDEKLKERVERFGEVSLAILCRQKETGEPTGTGFVHFRAKDSANALLDQLTTEEGVLLEGRKLFGHRAVQRNDAKAFVPTDKKAPKDKRNLYLLRASLIRPGTAQARGMSETDAKMRERLMEMARNKLKSMVMFVSPTRLAIHNIPFSYTDAQLKNACVEVACCSPSAIGECRVMRERKGEDANGRPQLGKSKGFGFVALAEHSLALNCLRKMNNDPNIFTNERRPIVEFSIENLNALRAKERRQKGTNEEGKDKKKIEKSAEEEVERTKRELMAGGKKWLPKKLGAKVRHRDNSKRKNMGQKGAKTPMTKSKTTTEGKKRRRMGMSENDGGVAKRRRKANGSS